ncbi:hypothetical protein ABPG74_001543 [Tetrahymena malaccensis]
MEQQKIYFDNQKDFLNSSLSQHINIEIYLRSNIIGIKGFLDLASTLSKFSNLTKLGLMLGQTFKFEPFDSSSLFSAIASCVNLSSLALEFGYNNIGKIGFLDLASALSKFSNLTKLGLMLGSTQIDSTGISALASVLPSLERLQIFQIKIDSNQIGYDGYFYFLSGLSLCTKLTTLSTEIQLCIDLIQEEKNNVKRIFKKKCKKIKRLVSQFTYL